MAELLECGNCFMTIQPGDETRVVPRNEFTGEPSYVRHNDETCRLLSGDRWDPHGMFDQVDYGPRVPREEAA